jgi:CBS domain-containing protein
VEFDPSGSDLEQCISSESVLVLGPKRPVCVQTSVTARQAITELVTRKIGCLLVVKDQQLVGVFTERDVLNKVSSNLEALDRPVTDFMTPSPVTIRQEDSIAYALQNMDLGGYRHLVIVDETGKPTGVISVRDILKFLCVRFGELQSHLS